MKIDDIQVLTAPVKDTVFVICFRGPGLRDAVTENDPQHEGMMPTQVNAITAGALKTANIANQFIERAKKILRDKHPATCCCCAAFPENLN